MADNKLPLEIERKFLIRRPEEAFLASLGGERIEIVQTYLTAPAGLNRRVRLWRDRDGEKWFYTVKERLTDLTRVEREREVSPEEARALLTETDPDRTPLEKVRWRLPYAGHLLEIDLFPFWRRQAYCEAELSAEDEALVLPPWMEVLREVTDDPRYLNSSLARQIPAEEPPSRG